MKHFLNNNNNNSPALFSTGLDIGHGHTKYNGGVFESKVKLAAMIDSADWEGNKHEAIYQNKTYIVGDGAPLVSDKRYYNDRYKICLLTGIALSYRNMLSENNLSVKQGIVDINANAVIGCPAGKWNVLAEDVMRHFNDLGVEEIRVDGIDYRINLTDLYMYFEGAVIVKYASNEHVINIDIGASTTDITEWENLKIKTTPLSIPIGINKLHSSISDYYNIKDKADLVTNNSVNLLRRRMRGETQWITSNGAMLDLTSIDLIIEEFVSTLLGDLDGKANFNNASEIIISGGGAEIIGDALMDQLAKSRKIENAQMLNQEIYQIVAEARAENLR